MSPWSEVRAARANAAARWRPEKVDLLLVAEAPPREDDRYFYFEDVSSDDWLFRGVCEVLFGVAPERKGKTIYFEKLRTLGVFLIDLKQDPVDGSALGGYVPELIARCNVLSPTRVVLIKATVYDAAFTAMKEAGLPVVNERIYFPSTGRQGDFRRQFAAAIGVDPPENVRPTVSTSGTGRVSRSEHRVSFSKEDAARIRLLLEEIRQPDRPHQKRLRGKLRSSGFYITDYDHGGQGFTPADFDALIANGTITIIDAR